MNASTLMSTELACCGPDDCLNRATQLMWERDCGCVPVVDADGALLGMLTDRDACMAAYTRGESLGQIRVGDVMTREVRTCAPGDDLAELEERMRAWQVRRVPVVEGGKLVGLVTLNDLARAADGGAGKRGMAAIASVGATLAAIGRPRTVAALAAE